ncbi:MAG: class A beta-lactamase, subclass A2 [Bacteroidales bacterium]
MVGIRQLLLLVALLLYGYPMLYAQIDSLKQKLVNQIAHKQADVGVSIIANGYKDTININAQGHYPMQSVFKLPIAMAVLSEIDKGHFQLSQRIKISAKDLLPNTWSPIRQKFPEGTSMTIADIIAYSVAQSDNNGCDILLRLIGGTSIVENFLALNQLPDIAIKLNEEEMHKAWENQFQNWATPWALTALLTKLYNAKNNKILSKENSDFLWRILEETATGTNRLKGELPKGTIVAHKTGTSGVEKDNIATATNDVGIIILPNGEPVFISVLVSNSKEENQTNEKIISAIAKAVWDYYSK